MRRGSRKKGRRAGVLWRPFKIDKGSRGYGGFKCPCHLCPVHSFTRRRFKAVALRQVVARPTGPDGAEFRDLALAVLGRTQQAAE